MTFVQAVRRRIVLTGLLLGICFLIVFSIGFHMINTGNIASLAPGGGKGIQHIIDTEKSSGLFLAGLYAVTFLGIAMAALLGADTLAGEINSGTIQVIVTKPIRRSDVVFGKWLGFAGLLGLYLLLLAGGTTLSILVQSGYVAPHLFAGLGLIYMESLLIMTVAMACSSQFLRPSHRRDRLRPVRAGLHRRLDRTDRGGAQQPDCGPGWHPDQPDHSERVVVAQGSL